MKFGASVFWKNFFINLIKIKYCKKYVKYITNCNVRITIRYIAKNIFEFWINWFTDRKTCRKKRLFNKSIKKRTLLV